MSKPRILITDDAGIRGLLKTITTMQGFAVETASDGAEAMEKMAAAPEPFDTLARSDDVLDERLRRDRAWPTWSPGHSVTTQQMNGRVVSSILRKPFDINTATALIRETATAVHQDRALPA